LLRSCAIFVVESRSPVSLAEDQRRVRSALGHDLAPGEDPAAAVVAATIVEWAEVGLRTVCPILTSLLSFDERLRSEVRLQLQRQDRPMAIHRWGMAFAARLSGDPDPWISWAAQVDAGTLAAAQRRRDDPSCPGDPMRAMLLIAAGADPRAR
jgi:hypothetical protein